MDREIIKPVDEAHWLSLRKSDLTSTEIACLFGVSPYMTLFELWHRKKSGETPAFEESERMSWGKYLEEPIARKFARDHGWVIRPMKEYIRIPELRLGSSFDFEINDGDSLLEIKNVDPRQFNEKWEIDDEDNVEAPPHIELQVQHQMLVSEIGKNKIGVLVAGNTGRVIARERDDAVCEAIMKKAAEFWKSIDEGREPKPDFERDAEFIMSLNPWAQPGRTAMIAPGTRAHALAFEYKQAAEHEAAGKKMKQAAKAELLTLILDAEKAVGEGFSISAGMIGPTRIEAYDRVGYRDFRVFIKKGNK